MDEEGHGDGAGDGADGDVVHEALEGRACRDGDGAVPDVACSRGIESGEGAEGLAEFVLGGGGNPTHADEAVVDKVLAVYPDGDRGRLSQNGESESGGRSCREGEEAKNLRGGMHE